MTTRYHARLKASTVRENNPPLRGARRAGEGVKESAAMGWRLGCGVTDHDLRRPGEGVKESAAMGWRLGLRRNGSRFAQARRRRERIGGNGLAPWLRRNESRFAQGGRRREGIGNDGLAPWLRRYGSRFAQARRPAPLVAPCGAWTGREAYSTGGFVSCGDLQGYVNTVKTIRPWGASSLLAPLSDLDIEALDFLVQGR